MILSVKCDESYLSTAPYTAFRKNFIDEFRPVPNSHNPTGIKLLIRLRFGLSHLNEHRFNHKFQNCINPKCICSSENVSRQLTLLAL